MLEFCLGFIHLFENKNVSSHFFKSKRDMKVLILLRLVFCCLNKFGYSKNNTQKIIPKDCKWRGLIYYWQNYNGLSIVARRANTLKSLLL